MLSRHQRIQCIGGLSGAAVTGRIRGHYRIDPSGRVESMLDVNGSALQFRPPVPSARTPLERKTRLARFAIGSLIFAACGLALMMALPAIDRLLLSPDVARYASLHSLYSKVHHHHHFDTGLVRFGTPPPREP
jgi:hypothetical protein